MFANIATLDHYNVKATVDPKRQLILVTYEGALSGECTRRYYDWLQNDVAPALPDIHGGIFDFTHVSTFDASNTRTILHTSYSVHRKLNLEHIPMALIASNYYQENMLRITAAMTPHADNKRIVKSYDEALAFIDGWQGHRTRR